ncbi:hypothetical protein FACS189444_2460 [Spirochaetia bacterium]|nr:hypothetical protein FACS189444_2460 [Spirochaetia bacterium]
MTKQIYLLTGAAGYLGSNISRTLVERQGKTSQRFAILGVLLAGLLASCASTGQFMPASAQEKVIGTVQTSFEAQDTWFTKNAINIQAYIRLLEAAGKKYSGTVEVRDIIWTTGKNVVGQHNKEIVATGKVVQVN